MLSRAKEGTKSGDFRTDGSSLASRPPTPLTLRQKTAAPNRGRPLPQEHSVGEARRGRLPKR